MASDYRKQIEEQKRRSAAKYAADETASGIAPIIGKTTPAYAANEIARQRAGQASLGDANAARAAANIARSPDSGAMIPSEKVGQANMLASMPNQGSLTPFEQPADAWIQRSRDFAQSRVGGTNQQLQMQRQEMGTNQSSTLSQQVAQLDPSIRKDAERAREWRIMPPQQRREEVDRLAIEQDVLTANKMIQASPEDIQKYTRELADSSGTFIDSYGRSSSMYSPDTQIRIRGHQREMEKEVAEGLSGVDKSKWKTEKDMYAWIASLPSTQRAGEFGKAIAFNIVRRYSTPQMKAQMEAEDRNQKAFEQTFTAKAAEEIVTRMAQEGKVSQEYAQGYRFTNDGSKEFATQIWLNRDNDPRAGQIVNEIMANAPVMWTEEGGRVVQDPAHQERRRMMLEDRKNQMAEKSKKDERDAAIRAEQIKYSGIQDMNPEYAKGMKWNEVTGSYDDLNRYAPEKQETNWDEIYLNDARVAEAEATMSWARFTNEAEAAEEAARQFPVPALPPNDPKYQQALAAQQQAVEVWRTQVNPPEKRAELEREIYNLKLRGQELRKGFKSPPAPEPTSGGYGLTMDSLGVGTQSRPSQYSATSDTQSRKSQPAYREVPAESGKKQNRQNYEKAGTFRVGTLPDESIYEQYKATGRVSVSSADIDKIPVAVSVAGKNEYITMVDPGEFSSFMKKRGVGAVHPVKVRVIPISDVAEISASDKEVESMRTRFGISPFASKKQVLAVAADRINSENKKRVHPFKNLLDWSPDLAWFQA